MADTKEIYVSERVSLPIASAVDDENASSADAGLASFSTEDFVVSDDGLVKSLQKVGGVQYNGTITAVDDTQLTWKLDSSSTASLERPHVGDKICLIKNYTDDNGDVLYYSGAVFVITSAASYNYSNLTPVYTGLTYLYTTRGLTIAGITTTTINASANAYATYETSGDNDEFITLNFFIPGAADVTVGATTYVSAITNPSVTYSVDNAGDVTLYFSLPVAAKVTVGTTTVVTPATNPNVTYDTDSTGNVTLYFSLPAAPKVTVGTTTTINPATDPAVTYNTDSAGDVTLYFSLPITETITTTNLHLLNTWETGYVEVSKSGTLNQDVTLDFYIPRGYPGQSFHINNVVSSTTGLPDASSDVFGYVYVVGTSVPYQIYVCIYDEDSSTYRWLNLGSIAGVSSIELTNTSYNENYAIDTYTVTMNDGTVLYWNLRNAKYFTVTYDTDVTDSTELPSVKLTYTKNSNAEYNNLDFHFILPTSYITIYDTAIVVGGNIDVDNIVADTADTGSYYRINIGINNDYYSDTADYYNTVVVGSNNDFTGTKLIESTVLGNGHSMSSVQGVTTVGYSDTVTGDYVTVIGNGNTASGYNTTLIGNNSSANADSVIVLGVYNTAAGQNSVVIGTNCSSSSTYTVIVGDNNNSTDNYNILIGNNNTTDSYTNTIVGGANTINNGAYLTNVFGRTNNIGEGSYNSNVVGYNNSITGTSTNFYNQLYGCDNIANDWYGIAIGVGNTVSDYAIVIGYNAEATATDCIAIGDGTTANVARSALAIGRYATVTGVYSIGIGCNVQVTSGYSISLGSSASATASYAISIGRASSTSGSGSVAIGSYAQATGANAISLSCTSSSACGAVAADDYSIAIGYSTNANDVYSIAIGAETICNGDGNVAIGNGAYCNSTNSIAIGSSANAPCRYGIAVGSNANATYDYGIAIGNAASSLFNGVAIGRNAYVDGSTSNSGGIAIGRHASSAYYGVTIGASSYTASGMGIAIGYMATAHSSYSIMIGYNTSEGSSDGYNTCIGYSSKVYTLSSYCVTLGYDAHAGTDDTTLDTSYNIAIGAYAYARGTYGASATATDCGHSVVVGASSEATYMYNIVLGYGIASTSEYEIRIGTNAYSVYIGNGSINSASDERDKIDFEDFDDDLCLQFVTSLHTFTYHDNSRQLYEYTTVNDNGDEVPTEEHKKYGLGYYDKIAHAAGTKKGSRKHSGVSAQDVTARMKEYFGEEDYVNLVNDTLYNKVIAGEEIPDGIESMKTVKYDRFVPFLIAAIRAQQKEIEALKEALNN